MLPQIVWHAAPMQPLGLATAQASEPAIVAREGHVRSVGAAVPEPRTSTIVLTGVSAALLARKSYAMRIA